MSTVQVREGLSAQQRAALLGYWFGQGEALTAEEVGQAFGVGVWVARRLLASLSGPLPICYDGVTRAWRVVKK